MRDDFLAIIMSHGRPDRVRTYASLRRAGYTGPIAILVDDEDSTAPDYLERYPGEVHQFCKAAAAARFDEADNFGDRRAIAYARNTCHLLARELGYRYYVQLDDDYGGFGFRIDSDLQYHTWLGLTRTLDGVFSALVDFLASTPTHTIAMSQGGDWIGGEMSLIRNPKLSLRRKAMNSFICDAQAPVLFDGRVNEDVNTYVGHGRRGRLFFTTMQVMLFQEMTQQSSGGMTDLYLDGGTYLKSFYTVLYAPSCARVGVLGDPRRPNFRLHHDINWHRAVPKIMRERHRKP